MRSTRVYVDAPLAAGARVRLPPFAADHLVRVLRLPDGAKLACFNGDGLEHAAMLEIAARGAVELRVGAARELHNESPLAITLVQSIARGERMDLILQKATELRVARFVPVSSERTEVRLDEERASRMKSAVERRVRDARFPELNTIHGFSIIVLGLFAFLGIPQIVSALQSTLPGAGGCGPIGELGTLASGLIGGLAALRMLKAAFITMFSASMGGASSFANALIESGEALFGMILASAAIPLVAWFLGTC